MMKRREFITLLGGVAVAWPIAAHAQQPLIGYLSGRSFDVEEPLGDVFRWGLEQSGYPGGHNVAIAYHFSEGRDDRLPELAADLVRQRPAVLVAADSSSALAAKAATTTI